MLLFLGLLSLGWLPCPPARISCGTSAAILEVGTVELFPRIHTTGCVDLPFTHWPGCPTGPVGCVSTDHTLHDSDTVSKPPGVFRQIRRWKAHVLKACDLPLCDAIPGTCRHLPAKSNAFAPGTLVVYWARQPLVRDRVKTNSRTSNESLKNLKLCAFMFEHLLNIDTVLDRITWENLGRLYTWKCELWRLGNFDPVLPSSQALLHEEGQKARWFHPHTLPHRPHVHQSSDG